MANELGAIDLLEYMKTPRACGGRCENLRIETLNETGQLKHHAHACVHTFYVQYAHSIIRTSFLVMGTADPTNSSSSPSETSPRGQIDRGPVRGRWGSLLKKRQEQKWQSRRAGRQLATRIKKKKTIKGDDDAAVLWRGWRARHPHRRHPFYYSSR